MAFTWNILEWIKDLGGNSKRASVKSITEEESSSSSSVGVENWIKLAIFDSAVKRIAASLAACEYITYEKEQPNKGEEYWRWNYEPNMHENKVQFFGKLVDKLYYDQEVLIVKKNGMYFIAESFDSIDGVFEPTKFFNIYVNNRTERQLFSVNPVNEDEVLYLKLSGKNVNQIAELVTSSVGALADLIEQGYRKAAGTKGIVKIGDSVTIKDGYEDEIREYLKKTFTPYMNSTSAVIPLFDGYDYQEMDNTHNRETASALGENLPNLISTYATYISYITGVPKGILEMQFTGVGMSSVKASEVFDLYVNFTIKGLADQLCDEINRKTRWTGSSVGRKGVIKGYYIEPNLNTVKLRDALSSAANADKLIASGALSVNEVRQLLSYKKLVEEWANKHYMTKNYTVSTKLAEEEPEEETIVVKENGGSNNA